jgi:hypothetical protein
MYIRISITQGTSPGPFTIYYNSVGNVAQVYVPPPGTPYPANNVTLQQLNDIVNPLIIIVPDTATSIILVDVNTLCAPVILNIPRPSPTPTLTPTVTPTHLPGTTIRLQWVVRPQVPNNLYISSTPIIAGGGVTVYPSNYTYGALINTNFSFLPLVNVTNNNFIEQRILNIPTLITHTNL